MDHCPTWTDPKGCTCPFYSENCPTLATLRMIAEDHVRHCDAPGGVDAPHDPPCTWLRAQTR